MLYSFSFLAGILTSLSPCVLPALPIIVGSAGQKHRLAPLAVAGGMVFSFTLIGVFLSRLGHVLGIDGSLIKHIAALLIIFFGLTLLSTRIKKMLTAALTPLSRLASSKTTSAQSHGLVGQFFLGTLLGAVWSPCVGPTLGTAVGLASQTDGLLQASLMMFLFSVGATLPLLFIAYGSRGILLKNQQRVLKTGQITQYVFGIILVIVGVGILLGLDKVAEAGILNTLPQSWLDLITTY